MKRILNIRLLTMGLAVLYGCAGGLYSRDNGTYLDARGEVVKAYPAGIGQTVQAALDTLAVLKVSIQDKSADGMQTIVKARTPSGSPLSLRFILEGRNLTVVKVRTGAIGYRDHEYSNQIHTYIDETLKRRNGPIPGSKTPSNTVSSPPSPSPSSVAEKKVPAPSPKAQSTTVSATPSPPLLHRTLLKKKAPAPSPKAQSTTVSATPSSSLSSTPEDTARPPAAPPTLVKQGTNRAAAAPSSMSSPPRLPEPDYTLYFEKDSNSPPLDEYKILNQAAEQILANPDFTVSISGFADTEEDPENLHLVSESRALAIKSYLIGKGVNANRISAVWHGSRLTPNSPDEIEKYRRVEIRLTRGL